MQIRTYRVFEIQIHRKGPQGFQPEIYRKGKLLFTVSHDESPDGLFKSAAIAHEAARQWIDRMYPPQRVKYGGVV